MMKMKKLAIAVCAADNGGALSHNNTTVMSILNCAFRGNRSTCPRPALSVTGKAGVTVREVLTTSPASKGMSR